MAVLCLGLISGFSHLKVKGKSKSGKRSAETARDYSVDQNLRLSCAHYQHPNHHYHCNYNVLGQRACWPARQVLKVGEGLTVSGCRAAIAMKPTLSDSSI